MLDVLDTEYIKMARAKGLSEAVVILKHALRNAIIALITFASLFFAINIGFVVVIERVFAWPGVGSLALGAAIARDYPVLQASVLLLALIILAVNILVDLSYGVLDPRIRVN
jgi:peptide/nickel transport system permease protein